MDNFQISNNFGSESHQNFDVHSNWDDCNKSYQLVCNINNECSSPPYGTVSGGSGSELYSSHATTNPANGTNSPMMEFDPIASLFTCNSPNCNNRANDFKLDRVSLVSDCEETTPHLSKYNYNNNHSIYSMHNAAQNGNYQSPSPLICSNGTNAYNNLAHCSPQSLSSSASYVIHPQIQMTSSRACSPSNGQSNHNSLLSEHIHANSHSNSHLPTASMSVNLSMNMTMGFTGGQCDSGHNGHSQVQWSAPVSAYQTPYQNQTSSTPLSYHHMHPTSYPSPSPTFTINAEFRPTSEHIATTLPPIEKEFAGVCNIKPVQSSIYSHQKLDPYHYHFRHHFSHTCNKNNKCNRNTTNNSNNNTTVAQNCEPIDKMLNNGVGCVSATNLCRICGKTYARPSTLKTHLRTHSGERPYRCNTCNKSFSQAANLTAHIRTHSGEKPFRCPVCGRKFSQSSSVTTHMRTHSGERPYRCCMCKKAFSDSSTLTKHLRIHSGEKPYQCKLCLLRFSQSGNLNRHMRIHANII